MDYLKPELNDELFSISTLGLAHIGDAVFELMTRTWLCLNGASSAKSIHGGAIEIVSARAQADAASRLLPELDDEEMAVYKRGRNAHVNTIPRSSSPGEYHSATGLEALFGYLYLKSETNRLTELFELMIRNASE